MSFEIPRNLLPPEVVVPKITPLEVHITMSELPMGEEAKDLETGVLIFGDPFCAKCKNARIKLEAMLIKKGISVQWYDIDTVNGRALAAFYDLDLKPLIIVKKQGVEQARWQGEIPYTQDVARYFGIL